MENIEEKVEQSLKPFVSVIMPVFNEGNFIETSLGALLWQTYPSDKMEIIIADGLSTDSTREKIEELKSKTLIPIQIVDNPKKIAPSGLNAAIKAAKGEMIVRVDGHCEVDKDYVKNCVRHLLTNEAEGVGGPIETIGETTTAQAIALAMSSKFGVGGSAFRTINDRSMFVDTVAFPGYTKKIIEKVGLFNEELVRNQDDEYNYRIRKMGGKILLSPDIRSRYYSRSSFKSLWRQYFQYGYWKVRVLQLHPRQMSVRQFIPFLFVVSIIITSIFSIFTVFGRLSLLLVMVSYLIANLMAAILTAKSKILLIPLLSISFAILHLSYGLGFLFGLFAFRRNWGKSQKNNFSTSGL